MANRKMDEALEALSRQALAAQKGLAEDLGITGVEAKRPGFASRVATTPQQGGPGQGF